MVDSFEPDRLPYDFFRKCEMEYHDTLNKPMSDPNTSKAANALIDNFDKIWNHFRRGGFFSRNEELEEYSTAVIKFFLIPYYIGRLHLLFQGAERPPHLEAAQAYLNAFSDEMVRFRLVKEELPPPKSPEENRNRKIAEFKERRELENRLQRMDKLTKDVELRGAIGDQVDEETERELVMDLLKLSVLEARSNARAATDELPFAIMHAQGIKPEEPSEPPKKLWFQRIDREQVRKSVFAPLEDVMPRELPPDDETFATPGKPKPSLDASDDEEREEARKEAARWDDWKDDHPPFSQDLYKPPNSD